MNETAKKTFHIHLVSDSTGDTLNSIARACIAQFDHVCVEEHHWSLIRTKRQLDLVFEGLRQWPGLVLYTFVDESLRCAIHDQAIRMELPSHSVLDPILNIMTVHFGRPLTHRPGSQHHLDADYFERIAAMDYALSFDDGNKMEHLEEADVVVLGVSRTSKTPTCVYLSYRGIRAANIPIVPEVPLEVDFSKLKKPLIVGLTKDPDSLVETRKSRLRMLNQDSETNYIDPDRVREELIAARRLFSKLNCPVIDVTRRSIEETAAEIMMLLQKREIERAVRETAQKEDPCP